MDIILPILFLLVGIIFFILGFVEERTEETTEDGEEEKGKAVVLIFALTTLFLFFSGICFLGITKSYYSPVTDSYITIYLSEYRPFSWGVIGFGALTFIITLGKIFENLFRPV